MLEDRLFVSRRVKWELLGGWLKNYLGGRWDVVSYIARGVLAPGCWRGDRGGNDQWEDRCTSVQCYVGTRGGYCTGPAHENRNGNYILAALLFSAVQYNTTTPTPYLAIIPPRDLCFGRSLIAILVLFEDIILWPMRCRPWPLSFSDRPTIAAQPSHTQYPLCLSKAREDAEAR